MKKIIFSLLITMLVSISVQAQNNIKAIVGGNIIDPTTLKVEKNTVVLIENNKIISVGKRKEIKIPANAEIINAENKWIIPGLVDAHVHFFQSGRLYTRPDIIDLREYVSYKEEQKWIKDNMEDILLRYLSCGITTIIDVGGPMSNFELRNVTNKKNVAPTLFVTGPLISTYQPEAFKIDDAPIIKVTTPEEARELVRKQLPYQPDFIKIWYIVNKDQTAESNLPIIKAAIEESHKNNLKVAVHATQYETARLAVEAGADILVHSVDDKIIDDAFIQLLKQHKVVYIPTLIVHSKYIQVFTQNIESIPEDFEKANPFTLGTLNDLKKIPEEERLKRTKRFANKTQIHTHTDTVMLENLKRIVDAGVVVATGTDAGNIGTLHASSYAKELEQMKAAGLSNGDILKASTINGAKVLGKEKEFGSIEKGKEANILLLNGNPLDSLGFMNDIHLIINHGVVINTDTLIKNTPEILAQKQLNAYNARNIDEFVKCYSNDVEVYNFPNTLQYKGREKMRENYSGFFNKVPALHCELVNRITIGNKVIDREKVTGLPEGKIINAIAIYEVENGLITKVYFMR